MPAFRNALSSLSLSHPMLLLLQPLTANQKEDDPVFPLPLSLSLSLSLLSLCGFEDLGITVPITPLPGLVDFAIYAHG
jgi:hypothetical protein